MVGGEEEQTSKHTVMRGKASAWSPDAPVPWNQGRVIRNEVDSDISSRGFTAIGGFADDAIDGKGSTLRRLQ